MMKELGPEIGEVRSRFQSNLDRVRSLVQVYDQLGTRVPGRRSVRDTDVLRSAVVLLHATMEDLLRGLAEPLLPTVSEDRLSPLKIPFGLGDDDKKEKVSLAQLAKFRGSTVDDLIKQMIGHWLERSNDNNLGDIKTLLAAIEIPLESIRPYDTRLTRHSPDRSDETSPPRRSSGRSQ